MNQCCTLYYLSTIACTLSEQLSPNEFAALSADLTTLGDMMASIFAHQELCAPMNTSKPETSDD